MSLTSLASCISVAFFFIASLFYFLYFLSSYESYLLDYKSGGDGFDSGFSGTYYLCTFSLRFEDYVGSVSGLGFGVFVPTGVESKCDIFFV